MYNQNEENMLGSWEQKLNVYKEQKLSVYSFPDWNQVTERIWVGGYIANSNEMDGILATGITHIMNLQIERDDTPLLKPGTKYLHLPIYDDHSQWESAWIWNAFDWVFKTLTESPKNKVYIHCAAGRSRSSSMVYGVLRAFGLDSQLAEFIIMKARPQSELHYKRFIEEAFRKVGR